MKFRSSIKKGDMVVVISGKEKGKRGKVLKLLPEKESAVVERVNFVKRHQRPTREIRHGGIIEREAPLHISNLMVFCPRCARPVRIGKKTLEDGSKVRRCVKCGEIIGR